jgi:hypothetical protein
LSTQNLTFAEMNSLDPITKNQRLDLLPEPGTIKLPRRRASGGLQFVFGEAATTGLTEAGFKVVLNSSFWSQIAASYVALASLYASAISSGLAILVQESQNECNRMKALTQCLPLFKNTMEAVNPFLARRGIVIHPEIRQHMNSDEHLRKIIDTSVIELSDALKDEDSYILDVFEESDADVPKWNENIIRVRIGKVNFEDKIRLWENLEEKVRCKIEEIRKQLPPNKRRKVDAVNESLSIRLETEDL